MNRLLEPDAALLLSYDVSDPELVAETPLATVWKVKQRFGRPAALKLYRDKGMRNEAAGYALQVAWNGESAAKLIHKTSFSALTEWLDGPSLGDLARRGHDKGAAVILAHVARRLHENPVSLRTKLPDLATWFAPLMALTVAEDAPPSVASDIRAAQELAGALLASQTDPVPLHGDLHHDNIRLGLRGFCAFDAKGVVGERAFELANAFRNPKGLEAAHRSPERIRFLADIWARDFQVSTPRLLGRAAAKCALSIAWRADGALRLDRELDLLSVLLGVAADHPVG